MRRYRKTFRLIPFLRTAAVAAAAAFVIFIGLRIMTPPEKTLDAAASPDGGRRARLREVFYDAQPALKVELRGRGPWRTVYYLDTGTNALPPEPELEWSDDSRRLYLRAGGARIWGYDAATGARILSPSRP
ncbi:hypothetical protein [Kiritimatiella glycovorans]|uniref:Uncharacterized protein n=1 Tax=Kiritimatiella glycovorans TaxID=1307763 RepID=A0A0G3ELE1_9BACT|nr:hypothetical protein [Kiritimatiella glycovorans]AKJ65590.1 hypothetical protein L21SP4_02364 [Kiritimatiella glycovorans]